MVGPHRPIRSRRKHSSTLHFESFPPFPRNLKYNTSQTMKVSIWYLSYLLLWLFFFHFSSVSATSCLECVYKFLIILISSYYLYFKVMIFRYIFSTSLCHFSFCLILPVTFEVAGSTHVLHHSCCSWMLIMFMECM